MCSLLEVKFYSIQLVPDRVFWKDNAKEVILPTLTGQMGVLTNHIPLLAGLDTGCEFIFVNSFLHSFV